jgi:aminoglycoside/choline kinase family phosphotransferase
VTASAPGDVAARIDRFLAERGLTGPDVTVEPLSGDASTRVYARVRRRDAPAQVLAVHPETFEIDRMPFASVARLLAAMPVPVPAILAHSGPLGILALEDLGDLTLQEHLRTAPEAERRARYLEAVSLVATMQARGAELASDAPVPWGLAFDVDKLSFELRFFVEHFLEAHRGVALTPSERQALDVEWLALAEELAAEPRVLCHRDFHSRNLMLHRDRLWVIDFQDARMGPDTYDLASLLRDSYVELPPPEVDALIDAFLAVRPAGPAGRAAATEADLFRQRFDVMALQRNLKALGTFGYQASSRHRPAYLESVPRTLAYVRDNVARNPRHARLQDLLARHVPELR